MYVTRAKVDNIRIISSFDIDLTTDQPAGWHVILGDNGSGKSTLIRAIAIALVGSENAAALRQDWSSWLNDSETSGTISLEVEADRDLDRWTGKGNTATSPITPRVNFLRAEEQGILQEHEVVSTRFSGTHTKRTVWGGGKGWFSAAFGPFRRFSDGDRDYDKLYFSHPRLAAHLSAFGEDVALSEALEWIKNARFRALENDQEASELINGLLKFVNSSELLPHGTKIAEVTSSGVMLDNGADTKVPIEEMSEGYRSVLAMTFEILRAMHASYGNQDFLDSLNATNGSVDLPGVILIDEIDAHLHPAWQKRIGTWFIERFPNAQFFVTTHSPIICQAAKRGSIWRLATPGSDTTSGRVVGQDLDRLLYGNVLEAYSTEYFGTDVTRSPTSKEMLRELAQLNLMSLRGALTQQEKSRRSKLQSCLPTTAGNLKG